MIRAPKGRTNMRNRKLSTYVSPYVEEWTRAEALRRYPELAAEPPARGPVSRFLRQLIEAEMEKTLTTPEEEGE